MNSNDQKPLPEESITKRRMPFWIGIGVLILLFPIIVIPFLVSTFREPVFQSVDDIAVDQIESIELFILNRPDGGPDIGGTRGMFAVPKEDFERILEPLRGARTVESESARGIWLGRMVVTFTDERSQTIMLHRSKKEYEDRAAKPLEIRIGRYQYEIPNVMDFVERAADVAGLPATETKN